MASTISQLDAVSLDAVLCTDELHQRPTRLPDYEAENRALAELATVLANSPRTILQRLVEVAKEICHADSAGISLLSPDDGGKSFYWPAVTGGLAPYVGEGTPRDFGPCGVVLDRDSMQLFSHPERYYPYLAPIQPPLEEVLLTPFYVQGEAIGTVWLVSHRPERKFDSEDLRLITSLGTFASAAQQVLENLKALDRERRALRDTEQALKESEAQFRQIADGMPQIGWTARPDGFIDYYNERWYEYTGFPRGQFGQASWAPILHPDDLERCVDTYFGCIRAEQPYQIEYRFKDRKTGGYRWFLGRALPVRDQTGRVVRWFGTCTDIDDTKRSGERLRLLWEAAAILLSSDDPDAMMRQLFHKIRQPLGVDTYFNFLVAESGDALRLVSCEGVPEATAHSIQRLEFGQAICGTVALERRPIVATSIQQSDDPKVQLVKSFGIRAYACNPLIAENRLLGTLSFASHTKDHFEESEVAFFETMCHYVTMAYDRLRLVNRLQEADRRKDEFLATLAHELRNPLAPVRSAAQLLKRAHGDGELIDEATDIIERQVAQMVHLVDDLLDVARITRGKLELRKARVELAAVIQAALEAAQPLIAEMGHEVSITLPAEPIELDADAVRLTQVLLNLLNNAAKYSERGSQIRLMAERQGSDAVVAVADTGIGIPANQLPHVFELFTQVERSLDRSRGGLGLGLTLVKRLTEMHGGAVEAASDGPGLGSTFTVRLPVANSPLSHPPSKTPEPTAAPRSHRLLVVDDNRDGADSLALVLRMLGNRVQTAYDGVEALQMAEGFRPEVALLDIGLPKLNGYEVARRIREQPWGREITLIAVTGWGQDDDKRRALDAGFDFHMVKPIHPGDLEKVLAGFSGR